VYVSLSLSVCLSIYQSIYLYVAVGGDDGFGGSCPNTVGAACRCVCVYRCVCVCVYIYRYI